MAHDDQTQRPPQLGEHGLVLGDWIDEAAVNNLENAERIAIVKENFDISG